MKPLKLSALPAALLICLCAATPAQVMRERPNVKAPPSADPGTPACAADDKVQVTGFSLDPAQPTPGQAVTVRLTVKSKCPSGTKPLDFQWEITDEGDRKLGNGDARLNPGASSTFTATWTAAVGTHTLRGDAYAPAETTAGTQNSGRAVEVTVQPKLVTMTLNHVKAKNGGAGFTANAAEAGTCFFLTSAGESSAPKDDLVTFSVNCTAGPSGGRGDFEAYAGFNLKNGWKVKSYEIDGPRRAGPYTQSNWNWISTPPSAGSTNPYVKWHLWGNGGTAIVVGIKITIEGPEGTDPYQ